MSNKIYLGRNCCWFINVPEVGTGQTLLELGACDYPFQKKKNRNRKLKHRHKRQRRQMLTEADSEWALCQSDLLSLHSLGMHSWWTLVTLLLPLCLQGGQAVQRAATFICHLFHFWGGRYFHIRFIFAAVGMFSSSQWHTVICLCPEEVRTRFVTGFPGGEGMQTCWELLMAWEKEGESLHLGKVKALEIQTGVDESA